MLTKSESMPARSLGLAALEPRTDNQARDDKAQGIVPIGNAFVVARQAQTLRTKLILVTKEGL